MFLFSLLAWVFFSGVFDQESSHDTSMVTSHVDHLVGLSVLHIPQESALFGQNVVNLFSFPFEDTKDAVCAAYS